MNNFGKYNFKKKIALAMCFVFESIFSMELPGHDALYSLAQLQQHPVNLILLPEFNFDGEDYYLGDINQIIESQEKFREKMGGTEVSVAEKINKFMNNTIVSQSTRQTLNDFSKLLYRELLQKREMTAYDPYFIDEYLPNIVVARNLVVTGDLYSMANHSFAAACFLFRVCSQLRFLEWTPERLKNFKELFDYYFEAKQLADEVDQWRHQSMELELSES